MAVSRCGETKADSLEEFHTQFESIAVFWITKRTGVDSLGEVDLLRGGKIVRLRVSSIQSEWNDVEKECGEYKDIVSALQDTYSTFSSKQSSFNSADSPLEPKSWDEEDDEDIDQRDGYEPASVPKIDVDSMIEAVKNSAKCVQALSNRSYCILL